MSERSDDDGRESRSSARAADIRQLREELTRSYVDAAAASERIADAATRAGLTPDLLEGTGDLVYGVIVQQLLLGARTARLGRELTERVLKRTLDDRASTHRRLLVLCVPPGGKVTESFTITNHTDIRGEVEVSIHTETKAEVEGVTPTIGRSVLEPGASTSVRVVVEAEALKPDPVASRAWCGRIDVRVRRDEVRRFVDSVDLEIWVDEV